MYIVVYVMKHKASTILALHFVVENTYPVIRLFNILKCDFLRFYK